MSDMTNDPVELTDDPNAEQTEAVEQTPEELAAEQEALAAQYLNLDELKGKKLKVKYDEEDEEEIEVEKLVEKLRSAKGQFKESTKRFQEAAEIRKQQAAIEQALKDPDQLEQLLKHFGHDVEALATTVLSNKLKLQMMSKEEREAHELRQKVAAYEKQQQEALQRQQQEELNELAKTRAAEYDKAVDVALAKTSLPKTSAIKQSVFQAMLHAHKLGYTDVTPDDVMPHVIEHYKTTLKSLLGGSEQAQLIEWLGEENAKKLRQADVSRIKSPIVGAPKVGTAKVAGKRDKKVEAKDFFARIGRGVQEDEE